MGTMFFLNGVFRPIYISNWANEYSPDVLKGIFNLDTNNIMPLTRITFPKEAAPVFKWENCEDIGVTKTDMEKTEIIVTVYYDDINE